MFLRLYLLVPDILLGVLDVIRRMNSLMQLSAASFSIKLLLPQYHEERSYHEIMLFLVENIDPKAAYLRLNF